MECSKLELIAACTVLLELDEVAQNKEANERKQMNGELERISQG